MSLLRQEYQDFKVSCNALLNPVELPYQISEADQNRFLSSVKTLVNSERFSFVVDLPTLEITHCIGAERWFGYSKHFSMFEYLKLVHPNYVGQLMQMAIATLEVASQNPGFFRFMDQRIIACLPMRERNGKYWWIKRESTSFQLDAKGRLTAYANLFTIVKEYGGESMVPRYSDHAGNTKNDLYDLFIERYRERIREHLPFTRRQFEILKIYSEVPECTNQQVGSKLAISKQTIDKHNQCILTNARNQFARVFNSAAEVADFLREEKII